MLLQLWGSWLVLFIIARVLGALAMLGFIFAIALIPGDKQKRFERLMAHNARRMFLLSAAAIVIALAAAYWLSQWWFTMIDFAPVGVAVFGSVGIVAITLIVRFVRGRKEWARRLATASGAAHDDDEE